MTDPNVAALSPDDLKDLPEELLGELAISESERQDFLVLETLRAIAKIGTTDKIMVEHYKLHGVVMTRAQCQARLGRLVEKGLAHRAQMGQYYATNLDDPAPTFVDPRPEPDVSGQADPSAPPART